MRTKQEIKIGDILIGEGAVLELDANEVNSENVKDILMSLVQSWMDKNKKWIGN
jgi:hypothetical protein